MLRSISTSPQTARKFKQETLAAKAKSLDNRTVFLLPGIDVKVGHCMYIGQYVYIYYLGHCMYID